MCSISYSLARVYFVTSSSFQIRVQHACVQKGAEVRDEVSGNVGSVAVGCDCHRRRQSVSDRDVFLVLQF